MKLFSTPTGKLLKVLIRKSSRLNPLQVLETGALIPYLETGSKIKMGDVIPPARLLLAQHGHDVVMLTCKSVLIYLKCFIVQVFCNVIH